MAVCSRSLDLVNPQDVRIYHDLMGDDLDTTEFKDLSDESDIDSGNEVMEDPQVNLYILRNHGVTKW